jgi:2-dehydro-3-deoxyphosphooctonate aldolase (KDO 8-P synthase)
MSSPQATGFTVGRIRLAPGTFFLIAGPDTAESRDLVLRVGDFLAREAERLDIPVIFKASYRKANRSAADSYTGPGLEEGLRMLAEVRFDTGLPLLSDVHEVAEVEAAAQVVDVLQVPAFLSRQTDLLRAAGDSGCAVNVKKGQFLSPEDMELVAEKVTSTGNRKLLLTERGTSFGYHELVVDMRGLTRMAQLGFPVVFDASHSVQRPSRDGRSSGGDRRYIPHLARAAVAAGADGIFLETHPDPDHALCDGPSQLPLSDVPKLLEDLRGLAELKRSW